MERRLASNGAMMTSGEKLQLMSVRKMPLTDLPNGTRNTIKSPQGISPISREKGSLPDSLKVSGIKRQASDCSTGPQSRATSNNGTSGPLVYVRRKLEETGKVHTAGEMDTTTSLKTRNSDDAEQKEFSQYSDKLESEVSCSQVFSPLVAACLTASSSGLYVPITEMPTKGFMQMEPSAVSPTVTSVQTGSPSSNKVPWKERFLRLQIFLNSCDQSSQEEYIQMLRSLSSVGRSKHAVELEKRAIHLLLEEGKELHRMKLLNVLGKVSP